jgi:hypothetical protein
VPLPPARLLTLIGTGDHLFSSMIAVIIRIMLSVPPPGAYGTTISMFFDGYLAWAKAAPDGANARASDVADAPRSCRKFISKFLRCEEGDLQARCIATRVRTTLAAGTRTPAR